GGNSFRKYRCRNFGFRFVLFFYTLYGFVKGFLYNRQGCRSRLNCCRKINIYFLAGFLASGNRSSVYFWFEPAICVGLCVIWNGVISGFGSFIEPVEWLFFYFRGIGFQFLHFAGI